VLPGDSERILADLRLQLKTEKYIKRAHGSSRTAIEQTILQAKGTQNAEREKEIVERLRSAVGRATLIHNAGILDVSATDPVGRIGDGFQRVIAATYTNLALLGGKTFSEQQLSTLVNPPDGGLIDDVASLLTVPGEDVLGHLEMRGKRHEQVTMKHLLEKYTIKPYGWDQWSVAAAVAYLAGGSKIEITLNGKLLKRTEITGALRNTQSYPNMVIAPQRVFDQKTVSAFRKFVVDLTDEGAIPKDPVELKGLATGSRYPFIEQLDEPIQMLDDMCDHPAEWFITDFPGADQLLDAKDNVIDPIKQFFNGAQRGIYDNATSFMQANQSNIGYLHAGASDAVALLLDDPQVFRGAKINQLGTAVIALEEWIATVVDDQRAEAIEEINARWEQVPASKAFLDASENAQRSVTSKAQAVIDRVRSEAQIPVIRNIAATFTDTTYPEILDELAAAAPEPPVIPGPDEKSILPPAPAPPKQTIAIKRLALPGAGEVLENAEDVERYLGQLRQTLLATINDNKRITL
jgi:hypothetical protein